MSGSYSIMHAHHHDGASSASELPAMPLTTTPRPSALAVQPTTGINAECKIVALPEELLSNIAVRLASDDLFAFRQVCRDVEAKTFHEFAKEYFGAKCFMFTTHSLKALVAISESKRLGHYLKHIYFLTASICERVSHCPRGSACRWKPTTRQREALLDYQADQEQLKQQAKDKDLLTKAFKQLSGLHLLAVVGDTHFLPTDVECYGMRKFKRTTNTVPILQPTGAAPDVEYFNCLSHVWRTMLLAVGRSGIQSIKRLETRFGGESGSHPDGLSPLADLRFKSSTIDVFSRCFANLEDLSICFRSTNFRPDKQDNVSDLAKATKRINSFAPVLKAAKNLKLSFDFGNASGVLGTTFLNAFDVGRLTKLVLDSIYIDQKTLASIVCKLKSVEFLAMHAVDLIDGSWIPILKALQCLPALDHVHLLYLQEAGGKVFFLDKGEEEDDDLDADPYGFFGDPFLAAVGADDGNDNWEDSSEPDDENLDLVDGEPTVQKDHTRDNDKMDSASNAPPNTCPFYHGDDFRDPLNSKRLGRGYYVCLNKSAIQDQIPLFIKEYHIAQIPDHGHPGDLLSMLGPNMGGVGVAAAFPPMTVPVPPAPAGAAQAGNASPAAQGGGGQGNGGPPGAGGAHGMNGHNTLAGVMAVPVGSQALLSNLPLASLLGFGPMPLPTQTAQQPPANATQDNPSAPATASSTNAPSPAPAQWSTVEDDEDFDEMPDLISIDQDDWQGADDADEQDMDDVD